MTISLELNQHQRMAIEHTEGPLLILAGAGSGKTRVLTHRMAHLVLEKRVNPYNLIAVTFTNKAAGEMKRRVELLLNRSSNDLWVSTFHSACLRILRRHASEIGYSSDFTIYDDRDQLQLITQCLEELKLPPQTLNPKVVAHRINEAKHEAIPVDLFCKRNIDFFGQRLSMAYQLYQEKLKINQAMDFGDLILHVILLFREKPHILNLYQNKFQYIHIDEYQDTNRSQFELIHLLSAAHRNLCAVGDDDQSIYKFRGAEIRNILDFQKHYPEVKLIRLEQNYRSTDVILKAAGAVVAHNKRRLGKTLWTLNHGGELLTLYRGENEKEEARFVVHHIMEYKKESTTQAVRYADMAIFYRTNAQSRPLEDELRKNRIPYIIVGGTKFYDRQEIKDILAYMKLLVNPHDALSLKRIINVPARGIGKTTIERLEALAAQLSLSMWEILGQRESMAGLISSGTRDKLIEFKGVLSTLQSKRKEMPLVDFMSLLFAKTGYWKMLEDQKTIEADGRLENLQELVNVIEEYAVSHENPTLEEFLDQASLMSDIDNLDESNDRLPLMTLHLAKGLEFPLVFMVGLEEGLFPHSRSLDSEEQIEEERRLMYVGMTRAKKKLMLSFVSRRRLFATDQYHPPSRFLEEIPQDLIHSVQGEEEFFSRSDESDDIPFHENASSKLTKEIHVDYSYDQRDPQEFVKKNFKSSSPIPGAVPKFKQIENESPYKRGLHIHHPVFGFGIVRACEGKKGEEKLTIFFKNGGQKKILAKYAGLIVHSSSS